ncbi:DinB family protein [Flavobacterium aciduliphilum]|uniref:DinB family protein n=1 Tax=Flavobacterium aciduliphilum TaxID=1101402 RepID=A0A328YDJ0_9FLAO|nr:DinB family protein [Flavobacterium aciduliphilum]RAR71294.1 DinB family protein [Flavobacterium aciduliphilum]
METSFKINHSSRKMLLGFLENYTIDQLNTFPEGFSNNLIWNIGHCIVVQQMLVYKLSDLPMMVSDAMVEQYRKGTKPEQPAMQKEVDALKTLLFTTLEKTEADVAQDVFQKYNEFTTGVGFRITNAAEAIAFNNYHEELHLGIMMQIRKFV